MNLSEIAGLSRQSISSRFRWLLCLPPSPELVWELFPPRCTQSNRTWVYGVDGKWIGRSPVLLIHRDVTNRETLWWSVARSESGHAIREGLIELSRGLVGHPPMGAVADGKPGIVRGVGEVFGSIPVQRCRVHVERDLKNYLPTNSPIPATQALRKIALTLSQVNTLADRNLFLFQLLIWESKYGHLLKERSKPHKGSGVKRSWWYTHSNLRRAWRLLTRDIESLFTYLEYPLIPPTNNSLEGINSHLVRRAGLSKGKQLSCMLWRLAFSRTKTRRQQLILWDSWKRLLKP